MADQYPNIQLTNDELSEILRKLKLPPWGPVPWDPVPEWIQLDREQLREFAKLQLDFRIKQLQIEQEKMQAMRSIVG